MRIMCNCLSTIILYIFFHSAAYSLSVDHLLLMNSVLREDCRNDILIESEYMSPAEREEIVSDIGKIVDMDSNAEPQWHESKHLAILLLGDLHATEGIDVLFENLKYRNPDRLAGSYLHPLGYYPAAGSLARIGPPVLEKARALLMQTDDDLTKKLCEWIISEAENQEKMEKDISEVDEYDLNKLSTGWNKTTKVTAIEELTRRKINLKNLEYILGNNPELDVRKIIYRQIASLGGNVTSFMLDQYTTPTLLAFDGMLPGLHTDIRDYLDEFEKRLIVDALGSCPDKRAVDYVAGILKNANDEKLIAACVRSLGKLSMYHDIKSQASPQDLPVSSFSYFSPVEEGYEIDEEICDQLKNTVQEYTTNTDEYINRSILWLNRQQD